MPELTCTMFETAQLSNAGEPDDSACFREAGAATTAWRSRRDTDSTRSP